MNRFARIEEHAGLNKGASKTEGPSICMPTARHFAKSPFRCAFYEAEDVLADCANVDFVPLEPTKHFGFRSRLQWRLLYKDVSRRLVYANPGLQPISLYKDYDVMMLVCPLYSDPLHINAIRDWNARCTTSICWVDELMPDNVPHYKHWLHFLREFDYVFLGTSSAVEAVSQAIDRPCYYLPPAVDALRFSPLPDPPARVVDVYSIGSRVKEIHDALLGAAEQTQLLYLHDTVYNVADSEFMDHREHRNLYANVAKRSRFFAVAPSFSDCPEESGETIEFGPRYFEGGAAGAVMLGQAADTEAFRSSFDWPNSVVEIRPDGSDTADVVAGLLADPERMAQIGWRNAKEALLRHDWVYRWKEVFRTAGIMPPPGLAARETRVQDLANMPPLTSMSYSA